MTTQSDPNVQSMYCIIFGANQWYNMNRKTLKGWISKKLYWQGKKTFKKIVDDTLNLYKT